MNGIMIYTLLFVLGLLVGILTCITVVIIKKYNHIKTNAKPTGSNSATITTAPYTLRVAKLTVKDGTMVAPYQVIMTAENICREYMFDESDDMYLHRPKDDIHCISDRNGIIHLCVSENEVIKKGKLLYYID